MIKLTSISIITALVFVANAYAADATANWDNHCSSCHGADGKGQTKMGKKLKIKDLTDAAYQASFTDGEAFKVVKEGVKDENGKTIMKAIADIPDDEINAVIVHVRSLKQ